jgi:hypothetical protein
MTQSPRAPEKCTLLSIGPWRRDPNSQEKRQIISEECAQHAWTPIWPSDAEGPTDFLLDRWLNQVQQATLVLADLTLERPSCYFELGCVEAMKATVMIIAETGTPIHQTSHQSSVIYYDSMIEYRAVIRRILNM